MSGPDLRPGYGSSLSEAVEEVRSQHRFDPELPGMFKCFGNMV